MIVIRASSEELQEFREAMACGRVPRCGLLMIPTELDAEAELELPCPLEDDVLAAMQKPI